jgi:ATP-dependent exoDNAse (exonuclease V) alpha subunit
MVQSKLNMAMILAKVREKKEADVRAAAPIDSSSIAESTLVQAAEVTKTKLQLLLEAKAAAKAKEQSNDISNNVSSDGLFNNNLHSKSNNLTTQLPKQLQAETISKSSAGVSNNSQDRNLKQKDSSQQSLQSSPTPLSAIERIRAKLASATKLEAIKATEQGHKDGTLPVDEEIVVTLDLVDNSAEVASAGQSQGMHGEIITYNLEQQSFIDLAGNGKPCVLIGAAGTGKTTCSKGGINALIQSNLAQVLQTDGHKHLVGGTPGILIISYTRRAVNNIRKVQTKDMQSNCITAHKLLEYAPEYYEIEDNETGKTKKTMQFLPSRNASNPLPDTISTIVVEEASMMSVELYNEICAALNHEVQWVFIGDIQQLPPVFGSAILGYKMLELPVIELVQVYRQAMESPIIRLAHRILSGKPIPAKEYAEWNTKGQLTIHPWKKKLSADNAVATLGAFFKAAFDNDVYDPDEDIILIPYNKSCGTIEINNVIANHLARKREAVTFEVIAGYNKHYFSAGDRVLYDREDAEIVSIETNAAYSGARVQPPSKSLDYWGHNPNLANESSYSFYDSDADIDFLLDAVASSEDRVTQSSHKLVVRLMDTGRDVELTKAAEVNGLLLAYALTVHKAQGSEWRKVFFCLHNSHATMLQRELLYTGVTRAREELYVICEPESFTKGILSQKIKGNTLKEKAEYFKGKLEREYN